MGATDFEIVTGPADPLVKGVGTKTLGKGRVNTQENVRDNVYDSENCRAGTLISWICLPET